MAVGAKILNVMEMRCGLTRKVRRKTVVMRELAGGAELSMLRWFEHMKVMEEDWLVDIIMGSDVRGASLR